jgi:transposase
VKKLCQDQQAVQAGLVLTWNNGMVEGHVNRLKFVTRSMYDIVGECLASGQ